MIQEEFSKIFEMSVAQRLLLVEDIWDSIAEHPGEVPLTDWQRNELEKRLNAYYENPRAGKSWAEVKEKILSGK